MVDFMPDNERMKGQKQSEDRSTHDNHKKKLKFRYGSMLRVRKWQHYEQIKERQIAINQEHLVFTKILKCWIS